MKKTLSLLLVCVLMLSMTGCGSSKKKQPNYLDNTTQEEILEDKETETIEEEKEEVKQPEPEKQEEAPIQQPSSNDNGIRPEFQKAMDDYIKFFETYCDFMKNYDASNTSQLFKYLELMADYSKSMDALDDIDESTLTSQEEALYTKTLFRIDEMLLEVIDD